MNLNNYVFLLLIMVALPFFGAGAFAQSSGTITGEVTDQSTGDALPGANVVIVGTSIGSAVNPDGTYTIRNVQAGTHTLRASYLGYSSVEEEVEVVAGQTIEVDFDLSWGGIEGEEITISVQAEGQNRAINQQIQRRTISNIVSSDRIREVPDVNAAESIGRLPGVSIQRSGGEANKVVIRGLSPQYNAITVGGVRMPATDAADRSVDLSMISPNMLDGIEVTKAITPNQDADAIGGTVDLQLRRAPEGFHTDISMEGGYNQLQESFRNYQVSGSISNRFFNERLGAILNFNVEDRNRSTDTFNANYGRDPIVGGGYSPRTDELRLQENNQQRSRLGGSFIVDYSLPNGRVALNSFYSTRVNDEVVRTNLFNVEAQDHFYEMDINENNLTMTSSMLTFENDFGLFSVTGAGSFNISGNESPENIDVRFIEPSSFGQIEDRNNPETIPHATRNVLDNTELYTLGYSESESEEVNYALQSSIDVPFRMNSWLGGKLEFGGKHSYTTRFYNQDRWDINLHYGGEDEAMAQIIANYPELGLEENAAHIPMSLLLQDYQRDNFLPGLDGEWPIGFTPHSNRIQRIHSLLKQPGICNEAGECFQYYERDVGSSFRNDYDGSEKLWAGFALTEFDIGEYIMFMPGFRYERMTTDYTAMQTVEARVPARGEPGGAITERRAVRENSYFLPMYHLRIKPTNWMDIRLARTNSLTRPDYMEFSPRLGIDQFRGRYIYAGNPELQPSEALNHDLSVAFYTNHIGLFTVSLFHKKVDGLIWQTSFVDRENIDGERIVDTENFSELPGVSGVPEVFISLNNENEATYRGIEFDWQTNFWWLPRPFNGVVLSANYTRIFSETEYRDFETVSMMINPPFPTDVVVDTSRVARLPNQPKDVANVQIGYDLRDFSARVSFMYQGDTVTWIGGVTDPTADQFTGDYFRIDARVRQQILPGLEVFANLNNINNRADRNFQAELGQFPTYLQNYGATFDLGVRFRY